MPRPPPPPRLIGRDPDVAAVCRLLRSDTRLLTLIGPAGAGKTSLALAVLAEIGSDFSDGVCFVPLEAVREPELVLPAVARALGVPDTGRSAAAMVHAALADDGRLLVLDNFEQVLTAGTAVADLLAACPGVSVLVTSRAALRLYDEREYPVRPLALPPAIELFVHRARAVRPDFALTDDNAGSVAALCRQLDGLPLAIELAAARTKVLPPPAILQRLHGHGTTGPLDLLTGGGRDRTARRQTLRGAISWSTELLVPSAQALLRRLGVFSGGWSLEAAEAVCSDDVVPSAVVLDLLTDLVDQSLVVSVPAGDDQRFRLLETIREFCTEQLSAAGEGAAVQGRHVAYVTQLAETARPELTGPQQTIWLARLETEHDNLRAALERSLTDGDAAAALRLVGLLARFWEPHGHLTEGRSWAERALTAAGAGADPHLRGQALLTLGMLASRQTDYPVARPALEAAEPLLRASGDRPALATTLNVLGNVRRNQGDLVAARALYAESLAIHRELGASRDIAIVTNNLAVAAWSAGDLDTTQSLLQETLTMQRARGDGIGTAMALVNLGVIAKERGDFAASDRLFAECLPLFRESGDRFGVCMALRERGVLAIAKGDLTKARPMISDSLDLARELADPRSIAGALGSLGLIAHRLGRLEEAQQQYTAALRVWRQAGVTKSIVETVDALALVAADRDLPVRAARLWGAVVTLRESHGIQRLPAEQDAHDDAVAVVTAVLGAAELEARTAQGRVLDLDAAIGLATSDPTDEDVATSPPPPAQRPQDRSAPGGLTARELEVLGLLAGGRSNREIAAALVLSPATVHQHLINIYVKLDVHSRAQATAYAFRHGLAPDVDHSV